MQDERLKEIYDRLTEFLFNNINNQYDYINFCGLHEKHITPYLNENNLFLYRYMNADYYSIRNLQLGRLYFKQPNEFNDPFDSNIYISDGEVYDWIISNRQKLTRPQKGLYFKEVYSDEFQEILDIKYTANNYNEPDSTFQNLVSGLIKNRHVEYAKLKKMIFVGCFSLNENNPLMWSHYANKHTGFCVKYDISRLPDTIKRYLHPIIYSRKPYRIKNIKFWIERFFLLHKEDNITNAELGNIGDIVFSSMVKGMPWEYENEWRFTIPAPELDKNFESNQSIPFDCATEVYLGSKIDGIYKDHISEIAASKGMQVFESNYAIDRIVYTRHT